MINKPNILVLGQNGFIGKKIFIFLKKKKYNLISYTKRSEILNSVQKANIIINCAGNNKNNFLSSNVLFLKEILKLVKNKKILLIQLSSLSVYGATEVNSSDIKFINENFHKFPNSDYGKSKLSAEKEIKKTSKKKNFNYIILRIGSIDCKNTKNNFLINLRKIIKFNFFIFLDNKYAILNLLSINRLNYIINLIINNKTLFYNEVFNVCDNITLYDFLLKNSKYKKFFNINISNKFIINTLIKVLSKTMKINKKKFNNLFLKNIYMNKKINNIINKINQREISK